MENLVSGVTGITGSKTTYTLTVCHCLSVFWTYNSPQPQSLGTLFVKGCIRRIKQKWRHHSSP